MQRLENMERMDTNLVNWVDNPIDSGISANGLVAWVYENNLKVLIRRVLIDPVRVENAEIGTPTADSFFGGGFERSLVLELIYTLVGGFAWQLILAQKASHGAIA